MILKIRKSYALVTSIVIGSSKLNNLCNKKIFELTEECHELEQIIEEPARITSNSQKLIDLVFSKPYLKLNLVSIT